MVIDLYYLLGLPRDADDAVINARRAELAADIGPDGPNAAQEIELKALDVLADAGTRAEYDGLLDDEGSETGQQRLRGMIRAAVADGVLNAAEEAAIIEEGVAMGLSYGTAKAFVASYARQAGLALESAGGITPVTRTRKRDPLRFIIWAGAFLVLVFATLLLLGGLVVLAMPLFGGPSITEPEEWQIDLPSGVPFLDEPDFAADFGELSDLDFEAWSVGESGVAGTENGHLVLTDAELGVRRDFGPDYEVDVTVRFGDGNGAEDSTAGIILRRSETPGYKIALSRDGAVSVVAPGGTILTAKNLTAFDADGSFRLTGRCVDDIYYVGVNGTAVAAVRGVGADGRAGLYADGCTAYFDDLEVRVL
ncbi:MAG: hypothetical protein JSW52_07505 [Candidatus Coatesbacteria bacterium]|nr:MAG: hypothetical protein JSW52_07505 [Candidatus Coatesbacteria bacterium]